MKKHAMGSTFLVTLLVLGLSPLISSAAEDAFKCSEQFGYYPDMQDCTKYYMCVFGDPLHEKCTGGLYFSIELQTCDWPRNVECANGLKPGEDVVPEFPVEDEVFSSSRRTSATASSEPPRSQGPVPPNKESVLNNQPFNSEVHRELTRNSAHPADQQRTRVSATTPSLEVISHTSTTQVITMQSPKQYESQTPAYPESRPTHVNDLPSTVSEDPLYAGPDQGISPPDNHDPQQPDFDEAIPPLVISGGGIHSPDGGHGSGALDHIPALGGYSAVAKPTNNAGEPNEGNSDDHDYTDRNLQNKNPSTFTATKPRSLESGSNNGRYKDPDVIIDYENKENDYSHRDRQTSHATPPPNSFDDNAERADYGEFDIYTAIGGDRRVHPSDLYTNLNKEKPQIYSNSNNNGHSKDPDVKLSKVPVRIPNTEKLSPDRGTANEEIKSSLDLLPDQEDYRRLNPNGEVIESGKNKLQSNAEFETFVNENKQGGDRNLDYVPVDGHATSTNRGLPINPNPNAAVKFDTFTGSNNGNHRDPDAVFLEENFRVVESQGNSTNYYQRRPIHDQEPNRYSNPEDFRTNPAGRNSENKAESEKTANGRFRGETYPSPKPGNRNREVVHQIDPKLPFAEKTPGPGLKLHEVHNNQFKDSDAYPDVSNEDFGTYTGELQGRKFDANRDTVQSQGVLDHKTVSNNDDKLGQAAPKDRDAKVLNPSLPGRFDDSFSEQYESEVHMGYGEYDSPRPKYTEDYYTNDDPETTTRTTTTSTTTQSVRTNRPTRPRRTTTTPAPTTALSTTLAPIRIRTRRPVTRPSSTKPSYVATTPASPPYRPAAVHPTPQPLTPAQKCDPRKCVLPDCRCGGTDIPGGLPAKDIPQIVLLTFDDAVNDLNHDLYNELFNTGRANPNGCPILGTFYVSHEWTDYGQVQSLYSQGHEIASHSITHSYGEKFSKNQWLREIHGQREILHMYGGVKMEDIRGMRAPFLQIGGNKMFEMLFDANFTYDSSMPVYENNPPFWPYTLDYSLSHECMIFPCPTKSFPGLWEVGMIMWVDLRNGRCSMGDACSNPADEESVIKMLLKNFNRHYKTNRAPFGLFYHSAWFNTQHHRRGFMKFLDEILQNDDVWLVTNWQAIQWIREPTSSSKMKDFEPFNCRRLDRPPPCPSPTVCNVWYQGGVRYMKTCQPCPAKYPWVGNTGYDGNSRG